MSNKTIKKKNIDWANLPFNYRKTDYRFLATYKNGDWNEGKLIQDNEIHLHEGSGSLHYAQQCFEGLKAYCTEDERILLFRPLENAKRMQRTAKRLLMPVVATEFFLQAVKKTVQANQAWVPPFGFGASFYIRPLLIGVGEMLGLTPAPEYQFRVFGSPVGPYFTAGKTTPIKLYLAQSFDRAAPQGIGSFKAGANYVAGLWIRKEAAKKGANEVLYLDSKHNRYLDESGATNIIILTKEGKLITPKSNSILPSITRQSAMHIAKEKLGLQTEERAIDFFKEIDNFAEIGACGTAAVLAPVEEIICDKKSYKFNSSAPILQEIHKTLTEIQQGISEDIYGWMHPIGL